VPRFVEAALRGEPLVVHGDGQQSRCFTDVRDAVRAVMHLAETPSAVGEVFNIGSSQETTIERLALTVLRLAGSDAGVRYVPYETIYREGFEDMRRRVPDCSKLRRTIGFAPDTPLEENLLRIIDYSRTRLQSANGSESRREVPAPSGPELSPSGGSRDAVAGQGETSRALLPDAVPALVGGTQ
jgi:UDP-glucose 4-epimerase